MSEQRLPWLNHKTIDFPDVETAWDEPNGLLAAGGDLSVERLVYAYTHGIFPWYNENEPILWWSPNPRCVLKPSEVRITKSLKKTLRKNTFKVTFDQCFNEVINACSAPRKDHIPGTPATWISDEMKLAYNQLFNAGYAHSVECWQNDELVGGLYGLAIGKVFFGESMFSRETDTSKVAFICLCQKLNDMGFELIDGQVESAHLMTLGFQLIDRKLFIDLLNRHTSPALKADLTISN